MSILLPLPIRAVAKWQTPVTVFWRALGALTTRIVLPTFGQGGGASLALGIADDASRTDATYQRIR
ncbi:hypothetical protein [Paraburkholderia sp.]|uniref:hypothetical protein n=1 Tax=Paraburkholderia sp. TaxID=1926495 RepID=UPI00238EE60C|nr:hypothetical protein [Paraburkholderia sp.]MDE1182338.1 hypothetical protein [Paraburkholderia sp.]